MEIGEAEENEDDDDEHTQLLTLVIVYGDHTYHGDEVKTHRSSSLKEWLDGAMAHHMKVTKDTKPLAIVDMLQVQFYKTISDKVAQLCKQGVTIKARSINIVLVYI
jgi:hypothetical protein